MTLLETMVRLDVDLEDIGVIIPAFNAGKTIEGLIMDIMRQGFKTGNIIVVDDGSTDRTGEIAGKFDVTYIKHTDNIGKGAALNDGFRMARRKCLNRVFTIDADGQHRVMEMRSFLQFKDNYDIIVGCRHDIQSMPILRRLVNRITSLVVSLLSDKHLLDVQCGFRLVDLKIFENFTLRTRNYQTESEMIIKASRYKKRIGSIPITTVYNKERSYINPFLDTLRFVKMALGFLWR